MGIKIWGVVLGGLGGVEWGNRRMGGKMEERMEEMGYVEEMGKGGNERGDRESVWVSSFMK